MTEAQAKTVEEKTRSQYHNRLWYRMRAGRITASKLKAVCHTDQAFPSESLVMSICHPELSKFKSTATTWGCEHERTARERYKVLYESIYIRHFPLQSAGYSSMSTIHSWVLPLMDWSLVHVVA